MLRCTWSNLYRLPWGRMDNYWNIVCCINRLIGWPNQEETDTFEKGQKTFSLWQCTISQAKNQELGFGTLPHSPYSLDLAPIDYYLFPNLKRWLCVRRFESNKKVEWETEGYFWAFDKSYYLEGTEKLKDRWTLCIKLKGEYFEEYNRFLRKKFILVHFITSISNTLVYTIVYFE